MGFVDADVFGGEAANELLARFGSITRPEQVESFQQLLRPYMLRRTKAELSEPLPEKRETLLKVRRPC